jgi:protein phosphatase
MSPEESTWLDVCGVSQDGTSPATPERGRHKAELTMANLKGGAPANSGNPNGSPAPDQRPAPQTQPPPPRTIRPRLTLEAVGRTHIGNVRELNEDQFLIARLRTQLEVLETSFETLPPRSVVGGSLLVVADGMGGHPAGEQASALAVTAIKQIIATSLAWLASRASASEILAALRQGFAHADATLARVTAAHPELAGMGTTMTATFVRGSEAFLAHAGDSRAYLYRQSQLTALTRDHTVARALVDAGVLPEAASNKGSWSHVVTNAVGGSIGGSKPELARVSLRPGDRLLLCTDGLTRMVPTSEIAGELAVADTATAADRLVTRALARGGVDNITVVIGSLIARP